MKKLILAAFSIIILSGCEKPTEDDYKFKEKKTYVVDSDVLHDCNVHRIENYDIRLHVVRCPLSQTTTSYEEKSGKTTVVRSNTVIDENPAPPAPKPKRTVVVNGITYEEKINETRN